jgi:hypothetical protein
VSEIKKPYQIKFVFLAFSILLLLLPNIAVTSPSSSFAQEEKKQIVLNALLDNLGQIGKRKDGNYSLMMRSTSWRQGTLVLK